MHEEVTRPAPVDLPDHLDLPLPSGRPYWYWIGGSPAVDLVNTLRERWRRRVECLVQGDDLVAWLRAAGLAEATGAAATPHQLERARSLREAVDSVLVAVVAGRPVARGDVAVIDDLMATHAPRATLATVHGIPVLGDAGPPDPVDAALGALARDAAHILGTDLRARLRICAADDCSARFLDRSPAGRRRWCTMAGCGNRAKVRRHRARSAT